MGMPCAYEIQLRLQENGSLTLEDIHPHWHFLPCVAPIVQPLVLEPVVAETRGRPAAAQERPRKRLNRIARTRQVNSTLRQSSVFERIDTPSHPRTRSQQ
jgi:hypothetical protein